ncbi:MAG: hypothetical protein RLY20_1274 [Verrucomicrobiota bacterium]
MKKLIITLVAVLAFSSVAHAQTYLTNTTLSAAVDATQDSIVVASATNIEVGGALFVDHELFSVNSVSGTRIGVSRLQAPTTHGSGAVVYVATKAQKPQVMLAHEAFQAARAGSCTKGLGNASIIPVFDITNGNYAFCDYETSGSSYRVWRVNNVQGLNGTGSLRTAWP